MSGTVPGTPGPVVVKVGGSLYDHPHLGPGLRLYLNSLPASKILVVAGGGNVVEAIRKLDQCQHCGEPVAHELALWGCQVTMQFISNLIGADTFTTALEWHTTSWTPRIVPLGCKLFLSQYEEIFGSVPHSWSVTTDTIAALAARVANARLILLKSVELLPGTTWVEAAARGWVDEYFPTAAGDARFPIEVVHFRRWMEERFPSRLPTCKS
jgi:aspartokinase-like uncharacterized kinase